MINLFRSSTYDDIVALTAACHQVFIVQSLFGAVQCAADVMNSGAVTFLHITNLIFPFVGIVGTRDTRRVNWRMLRWPSLYWLAQSLFRAGAVFQDRSLLKGIGLILSLALTIIQWHGMARLWRMVKAREIQGHSFFLNVVVLNKDEVIQGQMSQKVSNKFVGNIAGRLASRVTSEDKFSKKMATNMTEKIREMLDQQGITAEAKVTFRHHNFFVVRLTISSVDVLALIATKTGTEKSSKMEALLERVPCLGTEVESIMALKVANKLMSELPQRMGEQMREKAGLKVEVDAMDPKDEADFLFGMLDELHHEDSGSTTAETPDTDTSTTGWLPGKLMKDKMAAYKESASKIEGPLGMPTPKVAIPFDWTSCQFTCDSFPAALESGMDRDTFEAIMQIINHDLLEPFTKKWGTTLPKKIGSKAAVAAIKAALPIPPVLSIGHTVVQAVMDTRSKNNDWDTAAQVLTEYLDNISGALCPRGVVMKLGTLGKAKAIVMTWPDDLPAPATVEPAVVLEVPPRAAGPASTVSPIDDELAGGEHAQTKQHQSVVSAAPPSQPDKDGYYPGKYLHQFACKIKEAHDKRVEKRENRQQVASGQSSGSALNKPLLSTPTADRSVG